jgi:hypothetical protein
VKFNAKSHNTREELEKSERGNGGRMNREKREEYVRRGTQS